MKAGTRKRRVLSLMLTHSCNLACSYCYESQKTDRKIDPQVARKAVEKFFAGCSDEHEVEISFHGGEPFLAFEVLRNTCEWIWEQRWPVPYVCFATTNGTLVHGPIREWVAANRDRLYLGLSLDGTPAMHNRNRSNSFDRIDMDFFLANWPLQPVKMTVSRESLGSLAEGVIYLHGRGFKVSANLAFGIDWSEDVNARTLEDQLDELIGYYLRHPEQEPCDFLAMRLEGLHSDRTVRKWCGVGSDMTAVDVDGSEYPCQMFLPMVAGRNVLDGAVIDWHDSETLSDVNCADCPIKPICPTCYGINVIHRGDPALRDLSLCALTKIRAVASSYLQGRLLAKNLVSPSTPQEKSRMARRIAAIDEIQTKLGRC